MRWVLLAAALCGCSSWQGAESKGTVNADGYYRDDIEVTNGYPNGPLYRDTRLTVETLDTWYCMFNYIPPFDLVLDRENTPDAKEGNPLLGLALGQGEYQQITLYVLHFEKRAPYDLWFRLVFTHELTHLVLNRDHDADPDSLFYKSLSATRKMTPRLYEDIADAIGAGGTPEECGLYDD